MKTKIYIYIFMIFAVLLNNIFIFSQWTQLNTGTTANLNDIYFSNANTGIAVGSSGKVIRTTDGGQTWLTCSVPTVQDLFTVDYPENQVIYAGGFAGTVLRTLNCGSNWSSISGCSIDVRSIAFYNYNIGITAGSSSTLMCYTTNGGVVWNPRYVPTPMVMSITFLNSITLIAATTDMPGAFLYKSTNSASNWSSVMTLSNSGLNITYSLSNVYFKDQNTGFCTGASSQYGQSYGKIYRSTNTGNNWESVASVGPVLGSGMQAVHFGDPNTGFAAGNNGVIIKSTNGGANWFGQSNSITTGLKGIFMLNANTGFVCGGNGIILKTTNGGMVAVTPISGKVPNRFELYQNYPNPFNPSTILKFSIPKSGFVKLSVSNVQGKELSILVNEILAAGTYEYNFDAVNLSSGVYFYKIFAENYTETQKMVVLK